MMSRRVFSWIVLIILAASVSGAGATRHAVQVPREVLDAIKDDDPNPLPRDLAPWEVFVPPERRPSMPLTPPSGDVRTPAEYEHNDGLLISWGSFNSLLTAMTVAVTTGTDATMYIVVDNSSQQTSATSTLQSAGANLNQVQFITYSTDSVWMRDYGPRFIDEDGARAMVDHDYNRPRPDDDAFPDFLAQLWGEASYDIPLTHGGGNFHLFSTGEAYMTELILDENSGLSEADVEQDFQQYEGLDVDILEPFPSSYDSTQHIDMWMLPVGDKKVIIGQYPESDTVPHQVTEDTVTMLRNAGYTVYRTPGWSDGWTHYTYTNSVIINDVVLTCQFADGNSSYSDEDAAAIAVFEQIFPDRDVVPVDCSGIIGSAGAVHCIVMHVPSIPSWLLFRDGFESGGTSRWSFVAD